MIEKYPRPISILGTKEILKQMENCICKIYRNDGIKGTGFFCKILYNNYNIPVMITNNHIIDEEYIIGNNNINITLDDDNISKTIILNDNRRIYTNKEYDITIIEIKCEKDKLNEKDEKDKINNFMDLDEKIFINNSNELYKNHSIYIPQYLYGEKAVVSYGIIKNIDKYNICHYCHTESGSSGSPIINLLNNKIIGIHKEGSLRPKKNFGTYLKLPIIQFVNKYKNKINEINEIKENSIINKYIINKIEITLEINKQDINEKIYFLDNTDYIEDKTNINHFHDNLKELNEYNTDLYINNNKYKYQKYFIPKKGGKYIIKIIFKINIKDCSFMFADCKSIINIDFKYFNTSNVNNMRYMFSGCENIKYLDLSSFDTKNVTNMMRMFYKCEKLKELNLSSFNTENVNNMSEMFCMCQQLKELNLSSFDTKNVNNMMYMFGGCKELKEINLSSFNTKNVSNMMGMFSSCEHLKELNLSSFDTRNVNNMMYMFCGCEKLKELNLSSFDTKNVTKIESIFYLCDIKNYNLSTFTKFKKEEMINNPLFV